MAMRMVKVARFGWALTAPETAECGALLASACSKHAFWRGTKTVRSWSAGKTMPARPYGKMTRSAFFEDLCWRAQLRLPSIGALASD